MSDTAQHFTAWLVNDTSCLDQGCMDVSVLEDRVISYRTQEKSSEYDPVTGGVTVEEEEIPQWTTDSSKPPAFYAVTTVDAKSGDVADGQAEAVELMRAAGWATVGGWDVLPNAYVVTVERAA